MVRLADRAAPVLTAAAGGLVLLTSGPVWGQSPKADAAATYPGRPIRLVVPVPPGGSSDGMARILAQKLTDAWGQQVLVDNRPGAAEVIGTDIVAKSTADGHTLVLVSLRYSVNPSLLKLPYDTVKDFEPVTMTAAVGNVLVVNVKTPINSVKELIALAKQKPAELTFASSGLGGAPHLIGEFFAQELECDEAIQTGVARFVDRPHPARAERLDHREVFEHSLDPHLFSSGRAIDLGERFQAGSFNRPATSRTGLHLRAAPRRGHWPDDSIPRGAPR